MVQPKRKCVHLHRTLPTLVLILILLVPSAFVAQTSAQQKQDPKTGMGGVSTGEARTYTSRRTVGVVEANAPIIFEDVTARTALAKFKHRSGGPDKNYIVETVSGGVAIFDYDGDGRPDIYVSNFGVSRLYHNNGDGTFTDVAPRLGCARKGWSTGASFGDYDGDGRLDIFVPGYLDFDISNPPPNPSEAGKPGSIGTTFCQFRGVPVMCGPRGLKGEGDTLYHQKPDGTFEDVSVKAGVNDPQGYYGFSSAFVHVNEDDLLDLIVVNDSTPKQLYINKGDGTFEDTGYPSGVALNENGREQAGMGLAVGDYDNDSRIDFHITNFSDDSNVLYHNDGQADFSDVTFQAGHGEVTMPFLGWGTSFLDFDNDGWKDIFAVNGHVYPVVDKYQWGTSYAQQPLLFRNLGTGRFDRVPAAPGSGLAIAISGRGLAVGDLDGDGLLDAVINNIDSAPTLLRNVTRPAGHWIELRLVGDPSKKSPRDAIGAIAYVTTGKLRQRMDVVSGASYASQNDLKLHFGLGSATRIDKLEVKWPDGALEIVGVGGCDRVVTIIEGKGEQ